jgi:hypothetical protein
VCQPEKSKFLLTEYTHSHLDPFARDDSSWLKFSLFNMSNLKTYVAFMIYK